MSCIHPTFHEKKNGGLKFEVPPQMITQKMADQGRSDLDVVFTMILCATNFLFGKL